MNWLDAIDTNKVANKQILILKSMRLKVKYLAILA